jgi:hypothetical protein
MLIHHLRKTTSGAGGNMMSRCSSCKKANAHRRVVGNGVTSAVFDSELKGVKPTRVLQNIRIKKSATPKKYITFE